MYAVIETGGKQYRVAEGETLRVERIRDLPSEDEIVFDRVLMVGGDSPVVGTPAVEGARVRGRLLREDRARKVLVFKRKRRKGYRRLNGHRQPFLEVRIEEIVLPGGGGAKKKGKD